MDVEIGNRPLLATARDQKLSIERAEVRRVAELARRGLNVLLVGERGSGKTSALHAVAYELREGGRRAELVDAAPAGDLPELVRLIDRAVAPPREAEPPAAGARSDTSVVIELLRSWQALEGEVCVLLDEVRPALAQPFFGRLRDELWQTPLRFVVSAPKGDVAAFLTPPADAFFEAQVSLEPLSAPAQTALFERRLDGAEADRVLRALRGADLGNPRDLLSMAREALVSRTGEGEVEAAARERARRIDPLGPAAQRLLAELEAVGSASASDPRLLERLGWSRQRAAQVARTLEEAGLVTGGTARGEDGRVRKVFTPVHPLRLAKGR
jgi:hypothetical protein